MRTIRSQANDRHFHDFSDSKSDMDRRIKPTTSSDCSGTSTKTVYVFFLIPGKPFDDEKYMHNAY